MQIGVVYHRDDAPNAAQNTYGAERNSVIRRTEVGMSLHSIAKRFAGIFAFVAFLGASPAVEAQVALAPSISLYFSPAAIPQGGTSWLILYIYNPDSLATLTG